jgi:hypothetical protein
MFNMNLTKDTTYQSYKGDSGLTNGKQDIYAQLLSTIDERVIFRIRASIACKLLDDCYIYCGGGGPNTLTYVSISCTPPLFSRDFDLHELVNEFPASTAYSRLVLFVHVLYVDLPSSYLVLLLLLLF